MTGSGNECPEFGNRHFVFADGKRSLDPDFVLRAVIFCRLAGALIDYNPGIRLSRASAGGSRPEWRFNNNPLGAEAYITRIKKEVM